MEEFDTLEKVINKFKQANPEITMTNFFIAYKDMPKNGAGFIGGIDYPYHALLIGFNDDYMACFYLTQGKMPMTINLKKMKISENSYKLIPKSLIDRITIKNHALINKKLKDVRIRFTNGRVHNLNVKLIEKEIPYHQNGFITFMNKYSKGV